MLKSTEIRIKITDKVTEAEKLANTASKEDMLRIKAELDDLQTQLAAAEALENAQRTIGGGAPLNVGNEKKAKTLGEHFAAHIGNKISGRGRFSVDTPEFTNANTDTHGTIDGGGVFDPALTEVDKSIVQKYRRATVSDLFSSGTISGQSITYFQEIGTPEPLGATKEKDKKNQRNYQYTSVTDKLTKITGFIKLSDEMREDLPFIVSEINGRLLYDLELGEELQLLSGTGVDPNLKGLLNRAGILTDTATSATLADILFKAGMTIQNGTGLTADGIIINPADYQALRLMKDANGQYLAGGPFQGQYGQGGVQWQPPLWGFKTVVTPAVTQGTVIVGAFAQGATRYTKGGVRIESANTDQDDFVKNLFTTRAEKRIALAVRRPDAFVKISVEL